MPAGRGRWPLAWAWGMACSSQLLDAMPCHTAIIQSHHPEVYRPYSRISIGVITIGHMRRSWGLSLRLSESEA
jgi:hypothetical protein